MRRHGHESRPTVCSPHLPRAALAFLHTARRPRRGGAAAQLACLTGALFLLCVLRSIAFGAVAVASDILEVVATANFSALTPVVTGDGASARASLS